MPNVDVSIGPTIQILNAYYYDDLIIWAQERNLKIYENILVTPFHYNIKNADNRIKERIPHLKDYSGSTIDLLEKEKFIKSDKLQDFLCKNTNYFIGRISSICERLSEIAKTRTGDKNSMYGKKSFPVKDKLGNKYHVTKEVL